VTMPQEDVPRRLAFAEALNPHRQAAGLRTLAFAFLKPPARPIVPPSQLK
jgi:hypothetical protein